MRNPGGYMNMWCPTPHRTICNGRIEYHDAGQLERDGFTCFHCNEIEMMPAHPGPNDIGFCRHCMERICQKCSDLPCMPFEERLKAVESGIKNALEREWADREWRGRK